ncbi:MAG: DNA recombination protein RmuC [Clostridia bacterium]|nr:DNA recombination protein RmuC [Clostridia bacterium]
MVLQILTISLLCVVCCLLVVLIVKNKKSGGDDAVKALKSGFSTQADLYQQINKLMLDNIKSYNDSVVHTLTQQTYLQKQDFALIQTRLENILKSNEDKLNRATDVLGQGLQKLQADNEKKLDQMRQTVDEKLNVSLERRLTESFSLINQRLQSVYDGLGEMKTLANGVGDLKKVLTNVKTRGTWGEVQLLHLLEQILAPQQFLEQVDIKGTGERVDFAIVMPGKDEENILLPIDAKFPIEDYQRIVDASESGSKEAVDLALKALEKRVKEDAKSIKEKYIHLPQTTDFAIMYLAIEGLYAEVIRRPGLTETLQRDYKVIVCGPTTITALLNSLQLGFKTLSIEKRSSEVYQLLGAIKQEFGKFVDILAKTQKKLAEASNTIEAATKKSRTIEKKLKSVSGIDGDSLPLLIETTEEIE